MTAPGLIVMVILGLALLAAPITGGAQPPGKIYRLGMLCGTSCATRAEDAFRERLRQLGWVEGRTVTIEERTAAGRYEELPQLAAELVRLNVDVLVATGWTSVMPAARATTSIPVVFFGASDPVKLGIVRSLAHPGGNVTGLTYAPSHEYWPKLLELLKEAVPTLRRIGVISDVQEERPAWWPLLEQAGRALTVQVNPPVPVRGPETFEAAIAKLTQMRTGGVIVTTAGATYAHREPFAEHLRRARLPSIAMARELPEAGGFMSYGTDFHAVFVRLAEYVDRILRGTKPADLPVEHPTKFELMINLKTAKALGLTIPQSMLLRADEVIK